MTSNSYHPYHRLGRDDHEHAFGLIRFHDDLPCPAAVTCGDHPPAFLDVRPEARCVFLAIQPSSARRGRRNAELHERGVLDDLLPKLLPRAAFVPFAANHPSARRKQARLPKALDARHLCGVLVHPRPSRRGAVRPQSVELVVFRP